jgi:hypothetical protein
VWAWKSISHPKEGTKNEVLENGMLRGISGLKEMKAGENCIIMCSLHKTEIKGTDQGR